MSKTVGHNPRTIQNVFILLLLSVFACLSTFLVTMGAQAYRSAVDRADKNNSSRIMTAVVRSAVWAEDGGKLQVENYDQFGMKVLSIMNEYDGEQYYKRIYCMDGKLYECFQGAESEFDPEYGEDLCDLKAFEPSIEGKMLTVKLTASDDTVRVIHTYLRAGGAEE